MRTAITDGCWAIGLAMALALGGGAGRKPLGIDRGLFDAIGRGDDRFDVPALVSAPGWNRRRRPALRTAGRP